jgi:hypothetical protein
LAQQVLRLGYVNLAAGQQRARVTERNHGAGVQ